MRMCKYLNHQTIHYINSMLGANKSTEVPNARLCSVLQKETNAHIILWCTVELKLY